MRAFPPAAFPIKAEDTPSEQRIVFKTEHLRELLFNVTNNGIIEPTEALFIVAGTELANKILGRPAGQAPPPEITRPRELTAEESLTAAGRITYAQQLKAFQDKFSLEIETKKYILAQTPHHIYKAVDDPTLGFMRATAKELFGILYKTLNASTYEDGLILMARQNEPFDGPVTAANAQGYLVGQDKNRKALILANVISTEEGDRNRTAMLAANLKALCPEVMDKLLEKYDDDMSKITYTILCAAFLRHAERAENSGTARSAGYANAATKATKAGTNTSNTLPAFMVPMYCFNCGVVYATQNTKGRYHDSKSCTKTGDKVLTPKQQSVTYYNRSTKEVDGRVACNINCPELN